jgi:hypothetical protein
MPPELSFLPYDQLLSPAFHSRALRPRPQHPPSAEDCIGMIVEITILRAVQQILRDGHALAIVLVLG